MTVKLEDIRKVALALPETTEEPHHHFGSFRVRGRIFVTVPPGEELLHIFLPEQDREQALAMYPEFLEPLRWGGKVLGVRAMLAGARKSTILDLVRKAHAHKAPATLRSAVASGPAVTTASQVRTFLAKYSPGIAAQLRAARVHLAGHFPRGYELVYDNYNALVFGFSLSGRASDAIVSVAGYPRWVTLFFLHGKDLPDPTGILEGTGARVRSVRLSPPSRLHEPAVQALLEAAKAARPCVEDAPPLTTVIKSVSDRQRARRRAPARERS